MKIGDTVIIKATVQPTSAYGHRTLTRWEQRVPIFGLYLGKSYLREGKITYGGEYDPAIFSPEKSIAVAVIQPLDAHERYRQPVRVLPEDCEVTT